MGEAMSSGQQLAIGVLGILALSTAIGADDLPGLSLQLSRQLTPPTRAQTADDETERALLRVEWKAAQSGADEAIAIGEMLARLDRMGRSVAQLQSQITTAPTVRLAETRMEEPASPEPARGIDGTIWLSVAGGIAALSLLAAFRLRRRRSPLMEETTFEQILTTQPAAMPGAQSGLRGQTLAPPTIASESAIFDDDRPPIELDRPTPPPGDDQIPLELADILLSMGLADGAAKTLEDYVREHPRQALCHWLKLLDVYRRSDMQAQFDKAAGDLRQHFNVAPTDWQPPDTATPAFTLESYPHIRTRIQHLWRRRTCIEYLNQLLEDNRGGTRNGFPQPVVEEILFLLAILKR
jgi:hypothetical protein